MLHTENVVRFMDVFPGVNVPGEMSLQFWDQRYEIFHVPVRPETLHEIGKSKKKQEAKEFVESWNNC